MKDIYPSIFATLKADSYFATTLSGFLDSEDRFKLFEGNQAPSTADTPYITVDILPGNEPQATKWAVQYAMFHVWGTDKDWDTLWTIANQIADIFQATTCFASVGGAAKIKYVVMGDADFDKGENPALEQVNVSVGIRFGVED